jgi:acyl-CoA synthetase (AMP-forming)/AMP-acid ligase II
MNITRLFLGSNTDSELTHVASASVRVRRTTDELRANVASLAQTLLELGVRTSDAVLILGGSRVEIVESILATFNIGAVAVPVSPLLGTTHLNAIVARMRPSCCIFEDPPDRSVQAALGDCVMIAIKASAESTAHGWKRYRDLLGGSPRSLAFPAYRQDHRALVIHGSGSSGALKAVAMTHEELLTFCEYNRLVFAQYSDGPDVLTSSAATVSSLPLTHLAGLGNCLLSLLTGQRAFLLSSFVPENYLRLVEETRCAHILLVPSLYRSLLREPYLGKMDKSALRFGIVGGEPCPHELLQQIEHAFSVPLVSVYSMTECLSGIAHHRRDLFSGRVKRGSVGKQFFGELSLRDTQGKEQSSLGELWVRNATVHTCYLDAQLNEERLQHGWFRTGDVFFRDADGEYFYRGRTDDMFVCSGKNIYPIEIEQLLSNHPAVEIACAAPVTLPGKGCVPGVLVIAKASVSEGELQQFCMRHGQSHAVPQVIRFAQSLPLVGPGKVDRRGVQAVLQQNDS